MNWLAIALFALAVLGVFAWVGAYIDARYSRYSQMHDGINGINRYMLEIDLRTYAFGLVMVISALIATVASAWGDDGWRGIIIGIAIIAIFVLLPIMGMQVWFERRKLREMVLALTLPSEPVHTHRASDGE